MSSQSSIMPDDILDTMEDIGMLDYDEENDEDIFSPDMPVILEYLEKHKQKGYLAVRPDKLQWTPLEL
jgi:hypothetical protein